MNASSLCISRVVSSDLSGRLSKMSSWSWPRLLSNYFFSILTQSVRFCTQSLIAEFLFPISLPLSCSHVSCPSNRRVLRACLPAQDPGCEVFCGSWNPHSLGEGLCNCDYTPICGSPIQRCQFSLDHISAPHTPHTHLVLVSIYNINCIKSFLLVCISFSSIIRFHLLWPIFYIL